MFHLPDMAKRGEQVVVLCLENRLPDFLSSPCTLNVIFKVEAKDNFYLIHTHVSGQLTCKCMRCMEEFDVAYDNTTTIAVCSNDDRAEQLLELYESIVSHNSQIDLQELVIDELYLYAPQFHSDLTHCDDEINQILAGRP